MHSGREPILSIKIDSLGLSFEKNLGLNFKLWYRKDEMLKNWQI